MADTLETLYQNANPEDVYSLNTRRANLQAEQVYPNAPAGQQARALFLRAEELLNSGKTKPAIEQLQVLIRSLGGENPVISTHNHRIFQRIALAFLRLGEQQNCQINHSAESCVLPLRGQGIHSWANGSQTAIQIYEQILQTFPNDLESRYLLNIAHMTVGSWPEGVPEAWRLPPSFLGETREDFPEFEDVAMSNGAAVNGLSGGVAIADFNGDQILDIMASSYWFKDDLKLLTGSAEGGFQETAAGLSGITGGLNLIHADYDNDGDTDVLVLRGGWFKDGGKFPNSLLENQGDGTFKDVTRSSGILSFFPTQTAVWTDLDRDGWLDLVIGNEGHAIELYHNLGNGQFEEMGAAAGLSPLAMVKGITAGDINNDGYPDLFCSVLGGNNLLYLNSGNGISFQEIAGEAGVTNPTYAFPCWFWDYDQDGNQDLYVSSYDLNGFDELTGELYAEAVGYTVTRERPRLYRNLGNNRFEDVTETAGLDKLNWAMGSNFGDLDNNGFPDVFLGTGAPDLSTLLPNQVYRNKDGATFEEVFRSGRFGHLQKGHGVGFADFDLDGDQDVYAVIGGAYEGDTFVNSLYQNPGTKGHWVSLWLEGKGANRSAIGTKIEVDVTLPGGQTRTIYHVVSQGGSFGGNSLRADIGLGESTSIAEIRVIWHSPDGTEDVFNNVSMDQAYSLTEGAELAPVSASGITWSTSHHH